jgi:hypothetical protein
VLVDPEISGCSASRYWAKKFGILMRTSPFIPLRDGEFLLEPPVALLKDGEFRSLLLLFYF